MQFNNNHNKLLLTTLTLFQAVCALGGIPDHMNEKRMSILRRRRSQSWVLSDSELLFVDSRWSRQWNRKWRLPRSAESGERAKPGGHGGRGLDAAGPEAPEGSLIFLLGQPSREPQKEEEQEQTQVHYTYLCQRVVYRISIGINKVFPMLIVSLFAPYLVINMKTYAGKLVSSGFLGNWRQCWLKTKLNQITYIAFTPKKQSQ